MLRAAPHRSAWVRRHVLLGMLSSVAPTPACSRPTRAPGLPPTPTSVTRRYPGGDAFDPHGAALRRLVEEKWGRRPDPGRNVRVPLSDEPHWTHTRFALVDELVAFRYGQDYHALSAVFVWDVSPETTVTSTACMQRHEEWMFDLLDTFGVTVVDVRTTQARWRDQQVVVRSAEAELDYGIGRSRVSAAWAAYPAYASACLVSGITVFHRAHGELARSVRDRWVASGARRLKVTKPVRPVPPE